MRVAVLAFGLQVTAAAAAADQSPLPAGITVSSGAVERRLPVRTDRGYPAVSARALAVAVALDLSRDSRGEGHFILSGLGAPVTFTLEATYYRAGREVFVLAGPPYLLADTLFVPLQFVTEHLPRLSPDQFTWDGTRSRLERRAPPAAASRSAGPPLAVRRRRSVAIDPGHGGPDYGMTGPVGGRPFLHEKEVTLQVSRLLRDELERRGVTAVLTRNSDTLISLADRGRIASARGADLFVSIHVNAAGSQWPNARTARGVETYFLAEARTEDARRVAAMENASVRFETTAEARRGDPLSFILNDLAQNEHLRESSRLAELVQGSMARVHPGENRGVKQAGFMVLATTYMPAVLVELGFGSNEAEARYLTSRTGQRALARAIADGLEQYLEEYERRLAR
ncbi:MAG TPA: N-acetylmuramoyl-L-alanine amidase [Gemmatimonadales bacterium]|nr:N-acetylmuramoyl-L-alanine amidase [Gemmatimonadales bacterium]